MSKPDLAKLDAALQGGDQSAASSVEQDRDNLGKNSVRTLTVHSPDEILAMGVDASDMVQSLPPPEARYLFDLKAPPIDDPDELLQFRYLCRGGGLLFVGPTGIGKSSSSIQAMILWACRRDFFGINPKKPLKSLLIQAENDDGDLVEMRDGVLAGLNLTDEEKAIAAKNVIIVREDRRTRARFFAEVVRPLLQSHRPDLLWIDPALAYVGGESSSQFDVGEFLRNQLNPLIREYNCGAVVLHHTNKPWGGRDERKSKASDFAYLGNGSIEWANWARAILCLISRGPDGLFELKAAKRGGRLGWMEADGRTPTKSRLIKQSMDWRTIYWALADSSDASIESGRICSSATSMEVILNLTPPDRPISKDEVRTKAHAAGIALNRINPLINELVGDGKLHVWLEKRAGTNAKKLLARFPQPTETDTHG